MTRPATLFDRYVVVDWSAANTPKTGRDSLWIAVLGAADADPQLANPPTRHELAGRLDDLVSSHDGARTLVAVDAPMGYPAGAAEWFGLDGSPPWRAMWDVVAQLLTDDEANRNNRFEVAAELNRRGSAAGPFWGRHAAHAHDGLTVTKPAVFPVPEWRRCEVHLRAAGLRPASCWQLLGAGSVGGQALTLLPVVEQLVADGGVEVWPFTTGLTAPELAPGATVVAETWPSAFALDLAVHSTRDAAQVDGVARHLRRADRDGELAGWFAPELSADEAELVVREEGWALCPPGARGRRRR